MNFSKVSIRDEDHWRALRAERVGASEAGVLFGMHTYLDMWMLYKIKRKEVEQDVSDHAWWGQQDEAIIAKYLNEKHGFNLRKCDAYYHLDDYPLGASPDYWDEDQQCFVQIKSTTKSYESDDLPIEYEVQLQVEMLCTGTKKIIIAIKYANRTVKYYERTAKPEFQAIICKEAKEFWRYMKDGDEPFITEKSAELAKRVYVVADDDVELDARNNGELDKMVEELETLRKTLTEGEKRKEFLDAAIKQRIGDASVVYLPNYTLSAKTQTISRKAIEATTYQQRVLRMKAPK